MDRWHEASADRRRIAVETLVAPVDPEAVARDYHDHDDAPVESWPIVVVDGDAVAGKAVRAMRATLAARGIPVTPEVGE